ncbi:Na(+)-translocating NADH-quinone reductase subunit C, partial [Pseudoalteromonas sp. S4741]
MCSNNESNGKPLAVVVSLWFVFAVIVSLTSVQLLPLLKEYKGKH